MPPTFLDAVRANGLRVQLAPHHEEMSRRAAARVVRALRHKPDLLLGAASGDTPTRTYARLAETRAVEPALFRRLRVVTLDEWVGLPPRHPASCEAYVRDKLLVPLGVSPDRHHGWRGGAADPRAECRRMSRWLARHGPVDLCVLGLGRNGHLLMNEPARALVPGPHVARLAEGTRRHPMVRSVRPAPGRGLTLGIGDILRARSILLLVSGRTKSAPLKRMLEGPVSTACPASFLWLHPGVTVLCDREAARGLAGRAPA